MRTLMSSGLSWYSLPCEISQWPGLPLSLQGHEVVSLNYRAEHPGWLLYGKNLDKHKITDFQHRLGEALLIVSACSVDDYQVIHLAGMLNSRIKALADKSDLDVAQPGKVPCLQMPGLLVMDMDSTAIQIECIDEIAKLAGVGETVSEITLRAMQGELDFSTSLLQRMAVIKEVPVSLLKQVCDRLPLTAGLTSLVSRLQALGWYVAIVSGGFTYYADYLRDKLQLSAVMANQLEIHNDKLTGKLVGPLIDAEAKACALVNLAEKWHIPLSQTVAVGDGANDIKMLQRAGLGIAFHAKAAVLGQIRVAIHHGDLMGVLCILSGGLKSQEGC